MSGGGGGSSTPRSRDQPSQRATLGGKDGQNGGPSGDPCDITEITTLNSPDRTVLAMLRDGDGLIIELRDGRRLLATRCDNVAGSITSASHARIVQCMQDHYCPTFSAPQQHLRVWGTRWRGRREQLHQWTAIEQVELENS